MNAQQVWQGQEIEAPRMSLAYVRHVTSEFDRRRRRRAAVSYMLALICVGLSAFIVWQFFFTKPLVAVATTYNVLFVAASIYRLYRHLNAETSPADAGVLDTLRYQRRQLERQRDFRRNNWRWAALALLPGWALILASPFVGNEPAPWKRMGVTLLVMVVAMTLSAVNEERRARQSQREIDALDSLAAS
jgi:TRAP-type uncharacterized transport system fused permease subunit